MLESIHSLAKEKYFLYTKVSLPSKNGRSDLRRLRIASVRMIIRALWALLKFSECELSASYNFICERKLSAAHILLARALVSSVHLSGALSATQTFWARVERRSHSGKWALSWALSWAPLTFGWAHQFSVHINTIERTTALRMLISPPTKAPSTEPYPYRKRNLKKKIEPGITTLSKKPWI